MDSSQGRVVFSDRGYIIVEVLAPGDTNVVGYKLAGLHASGAIIYSTLAEAREALHDIEERLSRN